MASFIHYMRCDGSFFYENFSRFSVFIKTFLSNFVIKITQWHGNYIVRFEDFPAELEYYYGYRY